MDILFKSRDHSTIGREILVNGNEDASQDDQAVFKEVLVQHHELNDLWTRTT